jgi:very-short-patch-repair endonuclease
LARFDPIIARIAAKQDNVIDLDQLLAAGMDRSALKRRLAAGQLRRHHRGVFIVGSAAPTFFGEARAAAMAVGSGAAVSHRSAAALHLLRKPSPAPIDITVDGRTPRSRGGIIIHRSTLVRAEITDIGGIPVTTAARMICDLAATDPSDVVEEMLKEARVQRLVTDRQLLAVIDRVPHRPGAALIRELLTDESEDGYSRSKAERRLRALVRASGLPEPVYNQPLLTFKPDALWRPQMVAVEVDGRRFHGHPRAFENDRRRDQILVAAGYVVIRITWRQLVNEPMAVAVRLAQALVRRELQLAA